ncbi:MAG: ymgE [Deltaproteobacteria bacterium]|nr:ymgE [Deltaproteobacteria bacterium]
MPILLTLLIGLLIGTLARLVMPGKDPGGAIVTILLGVAGAVVAGMFGQAVGWYSAGEGPGIIASILGAVVLLATYGAIVGRRAI